ncbi:MAG: M20/M25/M40 family metallo-hydrolase [Cyclobacteriaceae bacterium]|nr:M20/M25/M40 family metallo-hydrolase [Cyclobacteriaceae bacterium]
MKQLSIFLITSILFSACHTQYVVSEDHAREIISTLAADKMKGRKTFSPEIDEAANYIASKFEEAGLETLPELNSYFQKFNMYSLGKSSSEMLINDLPVSESDYFITAKSESVSLDSSSSQIIYISANDDLGISLKSLMEQDKSLFVVIDPTHREMFNRYKNYFGRSRPIFELDNSSNKAFVISENNSIESFNLEAKYKVEKSSLTNVTGRIEGNRKDEIVLFSAHYDHIGMLKSIEGDSIANGANDDASGTTAVIELANYFASTEKPERTIYFVAFTAEEIGGYGSQFFSKQLNPDQIVAMFNIEMIGKPAVSGPNSAWITGFDKSDFGELLQKSVEGSAYEFYPDPYPDQNLFYRSDNATLARLGVPAHSISTTPIDVDKDYHQVSDEVGTLDIGHMVNTIKALVEGAKGIVSGIQTPKRVDTSLIEH